MFRENGDQIRIRRCHQPPAPAHHLLGLALTLLLVMIPVAASATTYNCSIFSIAGGELSATGINTAGIVVGTFRDSSTSRSRGFIRNSDGTIRFVDYPGADNTHLFTIKNHGVITGSWSGGLQMGNFTVDLQGDFKSVIVPPPYDQKGSGVSVYGINDDGVLSGTVFIPDDRFFFLRPDGTLEVLPGDAGLILAGSLNNSLQLLEPRSDSVFFRTQLLGSDKTLTPIVWSYPDPNPLNAGAFGLNNSGAVVGFTSWYHSGGFPYAAFERDPSGVYSEVVCPGVAVGGLLPAAINDAGVIAGGALLSTSGFIATPEPGTAHLVFSVNNLAFPLQPSPMYVSVTNTGDARLDIGNIRIYGVPGGGQPAFSVSGCLDPATHTTSLDAGASCVLTVTVPPPGSGTRPRSTFLGDLLIIDDNSPGAPHTLPLSAEGTPPSAPLCQIASTAAGPPAEVSFTMYDATARLSSVVLLDSVNAVVTIPSFAPGWITLAPNATQVNPSDISKVTFRVTNLAGLSTTCGATFGGPVQWTGAGGAFTSKIAIARNSDGRLQAFVRGFHNGLWTTAQIEPDGAWSGWQNLGGIINGDPAVGLNADGRLEVFALGNDYALWHIWQTTPGGNWSNWDRMGGVLSSNPTVATNADGRLEVVALGTDHALWHIWQNYPNGTWSDWDFLGGVITSNPAVAVNQDGRLEVFAYGTDRALWHIWQTSPGGGWSDWDGLGGSLAGDPVPVLGSNGRFEVFGRGTDDQLWYVAQSSAGGAWSSWNSLGGLITSDPAVVSNADGRLEAFARGADNALWHKAEGAPGSSWRPWASLSGVLGTALSAAKNVDGRVTVLAAGSDQSLWVLEQIAPGIWN